MVTNAYREEQKARQYLDEKIRFVLKGNQFDYAYLLRQTLLGFSVSRRMVESFINDFYIETNEIILLDGFLQKAKEVKK